MSRHRKVCPICHDILRHVREVRGNSFFRFNYIAVKWHDNVVPFNLVQFSLTHDPVPVITAGEIEDVLLVAVVRKVIGLDLDGELLHERARVASLGVRIGVPCFLLGDQRRLGQQALEPARQVTAHVVDFVCVLPVTARPVAVWLVLDYFHAATGTLALLPRFFLNEITQSERLLIT